VIDLFAHGIGVGWSSNRAEPIKALASTPTRVPVPVLHGLSIGVDKFGQNESHSRVRPNIS
jgi:hypothetical protein